MEAFDRSCKENTTPETCNVLDLMAENLINQEDSKLFKPKSRTTDPVDPNPPVPPSQQEDDSIDSDPFDDYDMDSDSDSDPDYKDTPEYQRWMLLHEWKIPPEYQMWELAPYLDESDLGWDQLLSLHGINRKRIPDWIICTFPTMYNRPSYMKEVNQWREKEYQAAIQQCWDEIRHQDED
eukprot:jgi/Psemu1/24651/gm1.24651_g